MSAQPTAAPHGLAATPAATTPATMPPMTEATAAGPGFDEKLVATFNSAALTLMISIGHRTGLFDRMAEMPPATSEQIARTAGLDERYVREWLGAMTMGGIVDYDPSHRTYALPPGHAAFLTRAASPQNLAVTAQFIPVLGAIEEDIVDCFRQGGGVPYQRFPRFHEVMAEESAQSVVSVLRTHILPLVPGLVDRLERGIRVLDLGCGRGRAMLTLAEAYPNSRFWGYDLSVEATEHANHLAGERGLRNVRFEARDLSDFDRTAETGAFDLVTTFDAIHDQANPDALLRGIRRSLADDGIYLAQDIKGSSHLERNAEQPLAPFLYTISCLHCMTVSLAQGGVGLGAMWGRELAEEMFREAGFSSVEVHELEHDPMNYFYVCRP